MRLTIGDVAPGLALAPLRFQATATRIVAGALASRDYSRLHHDRGYVAEVAGQRDIFANTQFQAALFERYLGDWSGPQGRVARMRFAMRESIFAGDMVTLTGTVREVIATGPCGPAVIAELAMAVEDRTVTTCQALYALPLDARDDPWRREGTEWLQPD
ncbi:MAG: hypothetical protein WC804_11300 [Sphingomonas sp.]|jgi:hypothetical protein|uniref:hypothetical protein n=1 Tax=Sphingomonas sp. TaxID=28214 RepID=UPI003562045F